ncbi:MAG: glycosyltransferase family 39 protein [Elusimicrobia bacterium]|nr:glycosyltransferase family 39 protein [Elusimicrobiota bacterium]
MGRHRRPPPGENPRPASSSGGSVGWSFHPLACAAAAFLWVLVVGAVYEAKAPGLRLWRFWASWPALLPPLGQATASAAAQAFVGAAWLALLHGSAWGLGRRILRRMRLDPDDGLERALLGSALGWGVLGLSMLALGLLGLWRLGSLAALLGLGWVSLGLAWLPPGSPPPAPSGLPKGPSGTGEGRTSAPAREGGAQEAPAGEYRRWGPWEGFLVTILAAQAAFNFFGALMPEIFHDALVCHLALPDLYWRRGGVVPTPENLYSGVPLMVQMLYGLALPLDGDRLCRLVHWSFGVETATMAFCLGRRFGGRGAGLLAAALFYGIPFAASLSWMSAVEHGQAMFETAAFVALAHGLARDGLARRWAVCAGMLTGFAMGSKYQAWPLLPVLGLALLWARRGQGPRRWDAAVFAGTAALVVAPWIAKNVAHYGNPVYPFLHERFAGLPVPRWQELMGDAHGVDPAAVFSSREGFLAWLGHPWRISFENPDHGPMLLLSLPFVLLGRFGLPAPAFCRLALAGLWLSWSLSSSLFRFVMPHLPLACLLTGLGLELSFASRARLVLRAGLAYVLLFQLAYAMTWFKALGATGVVLGREDPASYLRVPHPFYHNPVYPALEFVNSALPADAKVLFLGEGRRYYCRREAVVMSYFDEYPLQWWLARCATPEDLRREFGRAGITHVLVNRLELGRWQGPGRRYLRLTRGQTEVWQRFMVRYLRRVFERRSLAPDGKPDSDTAVYEVGPGDGPSGAAPSAAPGRP